MTENAVTPHEPEPAEIEFADSLEQASDAELLDLHLLGASHEAAETLVRRYATMVATICRLTVSDPLAAEDAFQATFLVFLQSAASIRQRGSVAAWLHGVAYRSACRIRKKNQRFKTEVQDDIVAETATLADDPAESLARQCDLETLNQELEKLPENLRSPLVEHYLLGLTAGDIADRLDLSTSAVEGRLRRGRRSLRRQLARRGVSMSIVIAGSQFLQQQVVASDALQWSDRLLATDVFSGGASTADPNSLGTCSPEVSSLILEETTMVGSSVFKVAGPVLMALAAGSAAVALAMSQGPAWPTGSGGGGTHGTIAMQSPEAAQNDPVLSGAAEPQHLGQMGGGGMGGGMVGLGGNAKVAPPNVITWQRPDVAEDKTPAWVSAGASRLQATENTRKMLEAVVEVNFPGQPLQNVIVALGEEKNIPFYINNMELENFGVDPDQIVDLDLAAPVTVRSALQLILGPLDLSYVVRENVIEITSKDAVDADPTIRFYDLAYILPNSANAHEVMQAIQSSIEPNTWLSNGGSSSISLVGSMMIVSAPDSTHQQLDLFLPRLAQMNPANVSEPTPFQHYPTMGGGMGGMGGGGGGFF